MRSLNIEVYWDKFRQGGLTNGTALTAVTIETLTVCAYLRKHILLYNKETIPIYVEAGTCRGNCARVSQTIPIPDHTQTIPIPDHTHTRPIPIPDHTHTCRGNCAWAGQTHQTIPDHTHTRPYPYQTIPIPDPYPYYRPYPYQVWSMLPMVWYQTMVWYGCGLRELYGSGRPDPYRPYWYGYTRPYPYQTMTIWSYGHGGNCGLGPGHSSHTRPYPYQTMTHTCASLYIYRYGIVQ